MSFKESLAADKKKTAVLCVLGLVLMVLLARQLFFGSTVKPAADVGPLVLASPPKVARSGAVIRPTVAATQPAPSKRAVAAASSGESTDQQRPTPPTSEKVVSVVGLPRTLSRNIFDTTSWSRFAHFSPSGRSRSRGGEEGWPSSLMTQVGSRLAAYGRSRHEEELKIDQALSGLRLESTMTGQVPLAYISGRLVREGDQVEGFSVVQIQDRQVMLRKSGATRVLSMP